MWNSLDSLLCRNTDLRYLNPWWWLAAIGLVLPLYGLLGVQRGILQATNTTRLGLNLLLEPVIKILATVALWNLVAGVNATVLGLLASVLIALAWTDRRNLERLWPVSRHPQIEAFARAALTLAVAQAVLQNADVLLARAFLNPVDAGVYAAVGLVGRALVATTWAINAAVFPIVAKRAANDESHSGLLWTAVFAVAVIGATVSAICLLGPGLMLGVLMGDAYRSGASWLGLYALAAMFGAISSTVSNHLLALGRRGVAAGLPVLGAVLQVALILCWHDSAATMARAQLLAMGVLCGSSVLVALHEAQIKRVGRSDLRSD